jgi:hypothetical protein
MEIKKMFKSSGLLYHGDRSTVTDVPLSSGSSIPRSRKFDPSKNRQLFMSNIPEDLNLPQHRCDSLKTRKIQAYFLFLVSTEMSH